MPGDLDKIPWYFYVVCTLARHGLAKELFMYPKGWFWDLLFVIVTRSTCNALEQNGGKKTWIVKWRPNGVEIMLNFLKKNHRGLGLLIIYYVVFIFLIKMLNTSGVDTFKIKLALKRGAELSKVLNIADPPKNVVDSPA